MTPSLNRAVPGTPSQKRPTRGEHHANHQTFLSRSSVYFRAAGMCAIERIANRRGAVSGPGRKENPDQGEEARARQTSNDLHRLPMAGATQAIARASRTVDGGIKVSSPAADPLSGGGI